MATSQTLSGQQEQQQAARRKRKSFGAGFVAAVVVLLVIGAAVAWGMGLFRPRPTVALVTNNADPFWEPVIAGAQAAADQYQVNLKVVRGTGDIANQSQAVQDLMKEGVRGIGISPIDAEGQTPLLREVAMKMPLVCVDSDCPDSSRLWFVGTDNYGAGRQVGSYVRDAIPDGGEVLICLGSITADNGKLRRQGVIDELLDRHYSPNGPFDAVDATLKGDKYTVIGTCVDQHDKDRAVQLAAEAIRKNPNLKCIVALYSYSAPAVLKALEQTDKVGQIRVIGFDVLPETLAAVESGQIFATMQQAQFDFGFDTVRALAGSISGEAHAVSASPMRFLGVSAVTKENNGQGKPDPSTTAPAAAASADNK